MAEGTQNPEENKDNVEQPAEDKGSKSGKNATAKPNLPLLNSANEYTMLYYYVKAIRTISLGTGDEIDKIRNTKEGRELFADIANKSLSIAKCNEILAKYGTYFNLVIPGRNEEERKEALKRYYHQSVRYSKSGEDLPTNEELKEAREEYDRSKIQAEEDARKDTEGLKKTYDEKKTDYKKKHSKLNRARFGVFGAVMLTGLAVATLLAGIGAVATALPLGFSWMSGIGAGIVIGSTFVYKRVKDGLSKLFSKALKKRAEAKNESDVAKESMKKAEKLYKSREKEGRAFAHSLAVDQEYQKKDPFPVQGYDPTALSTAMERDNSEDVKTDDLEKVIIRGPLNNEHDSDEDIKEEEKEVVEEEVEENKKQPPKSNEPKEKTPENDKEKTLEINNEPPVEENNGQPKEKGQTVVKEEPAKEVVEEIKEEKEQPKDETVKEVKEEIKEEPSLEVENTEKVVKEEAEVPTDKPERKSFVKRIADKAGQVLKRVKKSATKTATTTKVRKAMRKVRIDGNNIEPVYETEHNLQVDAENSDTTVFTTPDGKKQIIIEEAEKPTKSGFTNSGYAEVLKAGGLNDTYANLTVYCRDHNYDLTEAVEHHKSVVAESVKALLGDNASKTSDEEIMKLYTENNGYFYQSIKESVEERLAKEEAEEAAKKPFDEQEYLNWLGAEDKDTAEKLEVYCGKFNVNYEKAYNLHIPVVIEKVRKDLEETYPEATDDEIKEYYDQITVDIIHLAIEANHMEKAPEDKQKEENAVQMENSAKEIVEETVVEEEKPDDSAKKKTAKQKPDKSKPFVEEEYQQYLIELFDSKMSADRWDSGLGELARYCKKFKVNYESALEAHFPVVFERVRKQAASNGNYDELQLSSENYDEVMSYYETHSSASISSNMLRAAAAKSNKFSESDYMNSIIIDSIGDLETYCIEINKSLYKKDSKLDFNKVLEEHKNVVIAQVIHYLGENAGYIKQEEIFDRYCKGMSVNRIVHDVLDNIEEIKNDNSSQDQSTLQAVSKFEEIKNALVANAKYPKVMESFVNDRRVKVLAEILNGESSNAITEKLMLTYQNNEKYLIEIQDEKEAEAKAKLDRDFENVKKDFLDYFSEAEDGVAIEFFNSRSEEVLEALKNGEHVSDISSNLFLTYENLKAQSDSERQTNQDEPNDKNTEEKTSETEVKEESTTETEIKEENAVDVDKVCQEICDTLLAEANNDDLMSKLIDKNKETIKELLAQGQTKELILDELRNIYKQRKEAIAQENAEKNEEETERGNE